MVDQKQVISAAVLGAGVVAGVALLTPLVGGIDLLAMDLWKGITLGTLLTGGVSAFVVQLAMHEWM